MTSQFHMFDLHMHTPFSDGQIDLETQIETLIDLGFKIVGFSDHVFPGAMYMHPKNSGIYPSGLVQCFSARTLRYRKGYIRYLDRKYKKIRILNGGEIDTALPNGHLTLPRGIKPDFFDYLLIVKHHTIPKEFSFLYKKYPKLERWMWRHNPRLKLNAHLWEMGIQAAFKLYNPDIIAHPQETMPKSIGHLRDLRRMKRFVLLCKKYNVAIELNHLVKDWATPKNSIKWFYPILEFGHEYGVEFSLASDFHGFKKNKIRELLNHSQTMLDLVDKYDLKLIDPHKFLERIDQQEGSQ